MNFHIAKNAVFNHKRLLREYEIIDPKQVTQGAGGKWYGRYGAAPCPICQPERRKGQNALTINVTGGRLLLHCKKAGCDFRDLLVALGLRPGGFEIDRTAQANAERRQVEYAANILARARATWQSAKPIAGTIAEIYLRGRKISCPLPNNLRFHHSAYHGPSAQSLRAMIANVQPTGGIHRTFFDDQGKRLTTDAKMMQGPCAGGAARLSEALGPLVVCEGIETGLSLMSGLLNGPHTVWAALSTSGLRSLVLPTCPGKLILAPDGDEPGLSAAASLASRAHALGWSVSTMTAPTGQDFNDVLREGACS
ncbi:MAG: toprim domain-containing protein [Paracoccaceae bacterium]